MENLYNVDSPIDRVRRKILNETFADILRRFNNLQMQINILSGTSSVEEVLTELSKAINNANAAVGQLQNIVADSIKGNETATRSAIDNLNTELAAQLTIIDARLTTMQNAIDGADTATENANATTENTKSAITDARQAITDINNLIASMSYKGEFNASTTYNVNNIVRYGKSSYVSLKTQTGVIPIDDGANWRLIAMGGTDGTGAVSTVNNVEPDENGNVSIEVPSSQEFIDFDNRTTNNLTQRMINVKFPPLPLMPAVGDAIVDDTTAIQALINYASSLGKATLFFPKGIYRITSTLMYKEGVSFLGEGGAFASRLKWDSPTNGYILDTRNVDLTLCSIEKISFTSYDHIGSGIIGGSTFNNYNAFNMRFKDVLFHGLYIGLNGAGVTEEEDSRAVGVFDSYFENVWCSDCNSGLWIGGSGNTLINPRFSGCGNAIVMDYASPESVCSVQVFGGVFAANKGYDLYINDIRGLRNSTFIGTWFEDAANGIINIPYANTFFSSLLFINCQLHSKATQFGMLNFRNAVGVVKLDNCVLTQTLAGQDITIVPPNNLTNGTTLKVSNTLKITHDNLKSVLNYSVDNPWKLITLINGWVQVGDLTRYFKTDDNVVHLQIGMKDGVATAATIIGNLPEGYRPSATVRFSIFDGTNTVPRHLYVTSNGDIVIQPVSGTTLMTGVWAGYASFKVI